MRQSLAASVASWLVLLAAVSGRLDFLVLMALGILALGLTALWTLHLLAYTQRKLAKSERQSGERARVADCAGRQDLHNLRR